MKEKNNKTYTVVRSDVAKPKWYIIDAEKAILGRLSSIVAALLRGKNSPLFTPHMNMNHKVIVINAEKILLIGNKTTKKVYFKHTGYVGNERFIPFLEVKSKDPTRVIYHAVKGMLPKNRLGRMILKNLYIYCGNNHNHHAQQKQLFPYTV